MKRRLTKFVLFLLLGAIINVAVAWACAMLNVSYAGPSILKIVKTPGSTSPGTTAVVCTAFGSEFILYFPEEIALSVQRAWTRSETLDRPPMHWTALRTDELTRNSITLEEAHGWPAKCLAWRLAGSRIQGGVRIGNIEKTTFGGGVGTSQSGFMPGGRILPLIPIWGGFAINVVFYAALLWIPFAPFVLRRHIRVKRGRCLKCGYDLNHAPHDSCPECGWQLPGRQTSPA